LTSDFEQQAGGHLPRLLAAGVDHNDFKAIVSGISTWREWPAAWERAAERHLKLAEQALQLGRKRTAGEAFARAAVYFHSGQSVFFDDAGEKARLQKLQQAASRAGMPHFEYPGEQLDIPLEGITFPANLRFPAAPGPHPCVVLNAGADSTKEEFYTLENEFLKRGLATCSFDGPGQSLTWSKMKLRPDFERAVSAVIDVVQNHPAIDADRIGVWGRSMGGHAAPRAAARDPRIKACVSAGGFYDLGTVWDLAPVALHEAVAYAMGLSSFEEAKARAAEFTLEGVLHGDMCPTLVVHSGLDKVISAVHGERIAAAIGPKATLVVFPEGSHVCDNIPYKIRPLVSDWLAERL